jgi:hypothetical protein
MLRPKVLLLCLIAVLLVQIAAFFSDSLLLQVMLVVGVGIVSLRIIK